MEGVALRYWNNSKGGIVEHVVDVKLAEDRSAKGLVDIATTTLEDEGEISMDGLVSNTFDGASVMSGTKGGLQQLIQEHCGRNIPYIHCLNHRLGLVIRDTLSNILELVIEPGVGSKRTIPDKFQDSVLTDKLPIYRDMNNNLEQLHALAVENCGCPLQRWNHPKPRFLMLINLDLSWTLSKLFHVIQDFNARQDSLAELEFQKKKVENDAKSKKTVKPNQMYLVAVTAG
ncbi:Hypothetical predicted protein, partial [Paramuricea clavata]